MCSGNLVKGRAVFTCMYIFWSFSASVRMNRRSERAHAAAHKLGEKKGESTLIGLYAGTENTSRCTLPHIACKVGLTNTHPLNAAATTSLETPPSDPPFKCGITQAYKISHVVRGLHALLSNLHIYAHGHHKKKCMATTVAAQSRKQYLRRGEQG